MSKRVEMSSSSRHHSRSSTRNNGTDGGASSEYTYPSYTTFGSTTYSTVSNNNSRSTYSTTGNTVSSTRSSTQHTRVRVPRKRDENGKYLPHKHEHNTNDGKKKHRIVKHKDGVIAATDVYPETTGTHEEIEPATTSDLTSFPSMESTVDTSGSFTRADYDNHHHHRGYDREHHKWAVKKRKLELLKIQPKPIEGAEDQTFTALGLEEPEDIPRNCQFRDVEMTTTMLADQSMIDTYTETTQTTTEDTFGQPIPAVELFPDIIKARRANMKPGLADAGVQPEQEEWDPKKTEELRRAIYLSRDKLYPKRRRNVMYENPLPPPPGLEDMSPVNIGVDVASYRQDMVSARDLDDHNSNMQYQQLPQESQQNLPPPFKPPESEPNIEPAQFKYDQIQKYMEQAEPGSVKSPRRILTNKELIGGEVPTPKKPKKQPPPPPEPKPKPAPSVSFYSDAQINDQKSDKKPDMLTSVVELVTANSKSAEFMDASNPDQSGVARFVEVSDDMVPAQPPSRTSNASSTKKSVKDKDNEDEEEDDEEEEEEEEEDDEEEDSDSKAGSYEYSN